MEYEPVIGIDLGTTYSCVGIWKDRQQRVEILSNELGKRTTPSCVSFSPAGRLIGDSAESQAATNPKNTIFGIKRLIGRAFNDPRVQTELRNLPYSVTEKRGRPSIEVDYRGHHKSFSPEEISSMILLKMKQTAEQHLSQVVTDAVITVPAHFNTAQRQATKDAGTIAGLNVLRVVSEPTAAILTYLWDKQPTHARDVIVFDLGGGTLDVSLITIENNICEVQAASGSTHIGGNDFDNRLVQHFANEFQRKTGRDLRANPRAVRRLQTACERVKRDLSGANQTTIEIDALHDGLDFYSRITRENFEALSADLFPAILESIQRVLNDKKKRPTDVQDVILVGGCTRMPYIIRMLSNFFPGIEINRGVNADEAVAYGATIYGAILSGRTSDKLDYLTLDVLSSSLGIETTTLQGNETVKQFLKDSMDGGGNMTTIVKRNVTIPTKFAMILSNYYDNQNRVVVHIYEGEHPQVKDNNYLGSLELGGLRPAPRGVHQIQVTFDIDANGRIDVSVQDKTDGLSTTIQTANNRCLTDLELEQMIYDAQLYLADDETTLARVAAKNDLEEYIYALQNVLNETMEWMEQTPDASKEEYEAKIRHLSSFRLGGNQHRLA